MPKAQLHSQPQARPQPPKKYLPGDRVKKSDTFPNISALLSSRSQMKEAIQLITADVELAAAIKDLEEQRREGRERLAEIAESLDLAGSGMRWGTYAVYYGGMVSRRSLSKRLLIENGYVTAEQLEECMEEGTPYADLKVVNEADRDRDKDKDKG